MRISSHWVPVMRMPDAKRDRASSTAPPTRDPDRRTARPVPVRSNRQSRTSRSIPSDRFEKSQSARTMQRISSKLTPAHRLWLRSRGTVPSLSASPSESDPNTESISCTFERASSERSCVSPRTLACSSLTFAAFVSCRAMAKPSSGARETRLFRSSISPRITELAMCQPPMKRHACRPMSPSISALSNWASPRAEHSPTSTTPDARRCARSSAHGPFPSNRLRSSRTSKHLSAPALKLPANSLSRTLKRPPIRALRSIMRGFCSVALSPILHSVRLRLLSTCSAVS